MVSVVDRLAEVYSRHSQAVYAYCIRRLGPVDGADAAADVFSVAVRRVDDMPTGNQELPWLYGVARRVVADRHRGERRRRRLQDRLGGVRSAVNSEPEHEVVRKAEYETVRAALRSLSKRDREILLLRAWEELSYEEIATVIGTSPDTAAQRGHRAKQRLGRAYRRMERHGTRAIDHQRGP